MDRLASTRTDFATAAQLLVDFNTEYGDTCPDVGWLTERFEHLVGTGDTFIMLSSDDSAPGGSIGFGLARTRPQYLDESLECYLAELYIAPALRGQGWGSALLQSIMDEAVRRGATYIDLNTSEDDPGARRLYERFGFDCREGKGDQGALCFYYEREL